MNLLFVSYNTAVGGKLHYFLYHIILCQKCRINKGRNKKLRRFLFILKSYTVPVKETDISLSIFVLIFFCGLHYCQVSVKARGTGGNCCETPKVILSTLYITPSRVLQNQHFNVDLAVHLTSCALIPTKPCWNGGVLWLCKDTLFHLFLARVQCLVFGQHYLWYLLYLWLLQIPIIIMFLYGSPSFRNQWINYLTQKFKLNL